MGEEVFKFLFPLIVSDVGLVEEAGIFPRLEFKPLMELLDVFT